MTYTIQKNNIESIEPDDLFTDIIVGYITLANNVWIVWFIIIDQDLPT